MQQKMIRQQLKKITKIHKQVGELIYLHGVNKMEATDIRYIEIHLADDFSDRLEYTYRKDGAHSAEKFLNDILIPALIDYEEVIIYFDNVKICSRNFIHKAFGGLIREGFEYEDLVNKLKIISSNKIWIDMIWNSIEEAANS